MPRSEIHTLQQSDLNAFLFADVGVEANGMTLTVLSTLARAGENPWREAGYWATLPKEVAADGLARTIAAMHTSAWSLPEAVGIARRLVTLLPVHNSPANSLALAKLGGRTGWQGVFAALRRGAALISPRFNTSG